MKIFIKIFAISIPLLICVLIPLLSMINYDFGKGTLRKEIYSDIADSLKHALFNIPPFAIISTYAYCLIKKERSKKEIIIKMSWMLLPITVFSLYWYAKCFPDPLALGFLPFINLSILLPSWLLGKVANNAYKDTRNK